MNNQGVVKIAFDIDVDFPSYMIDQYIQREKTQQSGVDNLDDQPFEEEGKQRRLKNFQQDCQQPVKETGFTTKLANFDSRRLETTIEDPELFSII